MSKMKQLEERKAKIEAEIKQLKRQEAEVERKKDTRRKILVGAFILNEVDVGRMDMLELTRQLDSYLKADKDRELFSLPMVTGKTSTPGLDSSDTEMGSLRAS